jgi:hypothetical protein
MTCALDRLTSLSIGHFLYLTTNRIISKFTGNVLMRGTHELHREPQAPVIRSVVKIYDDPMHPLAIETFTNVRDDEQRRNFDTLTGQPMYIFTLYNPQLTHRLTKLMDNTHGE